MRQKMTLALSAWRIIVGIKDGLVLLFMLMFFGLIYLLLNAGPNAGAVRDGALLLKLNGSIVEVASQTSAADAIAGNTGPREFQLRDLVRALDAAARDSRVKAVVLDLSAFAGGGQVALERVGEALDDVKAAKKPVLAYAVGYDDQSYLLAAHATEVWMEPMGFAVFPGPGGSHLYYKGLIDKLGANVHVYRVGKYKSFVEPYTRADQSPEAREASVALLNALWADWQADVGSARPKMNIRSFLDDPQALVAANGHDLAKAALAAKVVDALGDPYAFGNRVAKIVGPDDAKSPGGFRAIKLENWLAANPQDTSGDAVGVITIAGEIVDGKSSGDRTGGDSVVRLIERGLRDNSFKALVVRIDSPGGSVSASEKIRLALMQVKARGIPVIASMSSVAASGGYWVSTPASKVFAEAGTITGSIGVFGIIPTFENSLSKLGVTHDGVAATPLAGQPNVEAGTSKEFDTLVQTGIDSVYQRFIGLVATARKLAVPRVDEIAQGRVWAGEDAKNLKLVDAFGTLDDALTEAATQAKLDPQNIYPVYLEDQPSWIATLFSGFAVPDEDAATDPLTRMTRRNTAVFAQTLADAQRLVNGPAIQVRCIECPFHSVVPVRTRGLESLLQRLVTP
jgi:protease-4